MRYSRTLFVSSAIAMIVACDTPPGRAELRDSVIAWPDTSPAEWIATSIGGRGVIPGTRVTMETSSGGVGGYTGCNWYGANRGSVAGGLEMTARGCLRPAGVQEQERSFAMLLPRATSAVLGRDTLRLRDSSGAEVLTFVRRRPSSSDPAQLVGTSWRLRSSTMRSLDTSRVTLRFTRDSVHGFGGCRDYDGTYMARADRLRFTYVAMRSMDCSRDRARVAEENLTTAFSETEHFELRDSVLLLTTFGGDTLRLVPASPH
jgi:heat shock protein HslJ